MMLSKVHWTGILEEGIHDVSVGNRLRRNRKKGRPSTSVNFFPVAASSSVITPSAGPSSRMVSPAKWRRAILNEYFMLAELTPAQ